MAALGEMTYTINGIKVQFPHKAYPSQISMMDKIIKGITREQNCLLESPTGSGKSLALLCSALAWQAEEKKKIAAEDKDCKDCTCKPEKSDSAEKSPYFKDKQDAGPSNFENGEEDDDFKPQGMQFTTRKRRNIKIGYEDSNDSDTGWKMEVNADCHSCTCQDTAGKRKVPKIYFGTRTHKQIAQIVRELNKTAYSHVKMTILSSREHSCIDPEVSTCKNKNEECRNKIEGHGCRYFDRVKRYISQGALAANGLNEAWDIEDLKKYCTRVKACPYYGARELRQQADIVFSPYNYLIDPLIRQSMEIELKEQVLIIDEAHNIEDSSRDASSNSVQQKQLLDAEDDLQKMVNENIKPNDHKNLKTMLNSFNRIIEERKDSLGSGDTQFDQASKVWEGLDMVTLLQHCGVGAENIESLNKSFAKIQEDDNEKEKGDKIIKLHANTTGVISGLLMVLNFIYKNNMQYINDYRVALIRTMAYKKDTNTENTWLGRNRGRRNQQRQMENVYALHFWCLNPAVAFKDMGGNVKSIILTSGTLSPMTSFQSELGMPFNIQLEASHVIGKSQVWVGSIPRGPNGGQLMGTYAVTSTLKYQDELGELVLQVCQTIPHGVLLFLPSYSMLKKLSDRWKETSLWERIEVTKDIICEPRGGDKHVFEELMDRFYSVIEETKDVETVEGQTGALFIAVCRGKVSEGLDFADDNARAVIAVGIPFPNVKDTQVNLKREYNNLHRSKGLLSGSDWYEIQAYRALNQALGRCIRHRTDWGALLLVDERYGKNPNRYMKGISKWVRQKAQHYQTFTQAKVSLDRFTRERLENPATNDISIMNASTLNNTVMTIQQTEQPLFKTPYIPAPATENMPPPTTIPGGQLGQTDYIPDRFINNSQAGGFLPESQGKDPCIDLTIPDSDPTALTTSPDASAPDNQRPTSSKVSPVSAKNADCTVNIAQFFAQTQHKKSSSNSPPTSTAPVITDVVDSKTASIICKVRNINLENPYSPYVSKCSGESNKSRLVSETDHKNETPTKGVCSGAGEMGLPLISPIKCEKLAGNSKTNTEQTTFQPAFTSTQAAPRGSNTIGGTQDFVPGFTSTQMPPKDNSKSHPPVRQNRKGGSLFQFVSIPDTSLVNNDDTIVQSGNINNGSPVLFDGEADENLNIKKNKSEHKNKSMKKTNSNAIVDDSKTIHQKEREDSGDFDFSPFNKDFSPIKKEAEITVIAESPTKEEEVLDFGEEDETTGFGFRRRSGTKTAKLSLDISTNMSQIEKYDITISETQEQKADDTADFETSRVKHRLSTSRRRLSIPKSASKSNDKSPVQSDSKQNLNKSEKSSPVDSKSDGGILDKIKTKRHTVDSKIDEGIFDKIKTEPETMDSDLNNQQNDDGEVTANDDLKRGRKRKAGRTNTRRVKKGAQFEISDDEEEMIAFKCPQCHSTFGTAASSDISKRTELPTFLRDLPGSENWTEVVVTQSSQIKLDVTQIVSSVNKRNGIKLNSRWVEFDKCVVQYVQCGGCNTTLLACQVIMAVQGAKSHVKAGEVWLIPGSG